jgi:dTDP-4-amino-4,6-dideoxygalactose transaminase
VTAAVRVPYASARRRRAGDRLLAAVLDVAATDRFILKDSVAGLEAAVQALTGAGAVVACGGRSGGLVLAATALGAGRGDPVAVPASAGPAVVAAISVLGAIPVPVDVCPQSGLPDPDLLRRVDAALAVVDHPLQVAGAGPAGGAGRAVVHDATGLSDAVLGTWADGRWDDGAVAALTADGALLDVGEGALVLTGAEPGAAVRMLRNHGQDGVHRFLHHLLGRNSRMDELVAAFAAGMLAEAEEHRRRTAELAAGYDARAAQLRAAGARPVDPAAAPRGRGYAVLAERPGELRARLADRGVQAAPALAAPPWLDPAAHPGAAELLAGAVLLPLHSDLSPEQVEVVVDAVAGSDG